MAVCGWFVFLLWLLAQPDVWKAIARDDVGRRFFAARQQPLDTATRRWRGE